jgi:protoporphyrin/coproporphyrin ferrochelatase
VFLAKETAIVLLNMGGPDSVEAVEPFLYNIFADPWMIRLPWFAKPFQRKIARAISRTRGPEARHNYSSIGGESPLLRITGAQANRVAAVLGCEGYVAMRYWKPFAADTVKLMIEEGMRRAVLLSGYPQHSRSTCQSGVDDFTRAWVAAGRDATDLLPIQRWFDDPGYVDAVAATVRETIGGLLPESSCVLFSAHGLPQRYIRQGDTYEREIRTTMRLVVEKLGLELPYELSFQSKVGPERWLEPSTPDKIRELGERGVKHLVVVPLGFIADNVETVQEIDLQFSALAREQKMIFYRCPTPNDRPDFIAALARLVRGRAHEPRPAGAPA